MNALSIARQAYSAASTPTRTPKDTEYEVLARITHRLRTAAQRGAAGFPDLAAALHDNQRLWNIFASDVADPGNELPGELRARIFYLAEFTDLHTSQILARKASVAALLEVNTAILRGLRHGAS
ncbi:MAG: flagellar biosynthesis regulator FlaF [Pseudomonadota bacterium]